MGKYVSAVLEFDVRVEGGVAEVGEAAGTLVLPLHVVVVVEIGANHNMVYGEGGERVSLDGGNCNY